MIVETAEYTIEDLLPRALYIFLQHPLVLHVFLSVYWFIVLDCYLFRNKSREMCEQIISMFASIYIKHEQHWRELTSNRRLWRSAVRVVCEMLLWLELYTTDSRLKLICWSSLCDVPYVPAEEEI